MPSSENITLPSSRKNWLLAKSQYKVSPKSLYSSLNSTGNEALCPAVDNAHTEQIASIPTKNTLTTKLNNQIQISAIFYGASGCDQVKPCSLLHERAIYRIVRKNSFISRPPSCEPASVNPHASLRLFLFSLISNDYHFTISYSPARLPNSSASPK